MNGRMTNPAAALDATAAIQQLYKPVCNGGVSPAILELVHLRAGQINGCSPCVDFGIEQLSELGESAGWIGLVAAWCDTPYYSEEERAALAPAEAATRLADRADAVNVEVWEAAAQFFDEKQLAGIVMMIAVTNLFNRLDATARQQAGKAW
ncbi:carboxymuconolactone decarboxylase family protein [Nocardia sp. NPDC101769]|uniref:carboxymuconolactone decarboxylase family protein n=1 Tax=Nocardia sp. NPDC101769 TaxID=3364333 RepID=UPI00381C177C